MKKNPFYLSVCAIFLGALLIGSVPVFAVGSSLYINTASNAVSAALSSLYAISGTGDTALLPGNKAYAMTATGLQEVSSTAATPTPKPTIDDDGSAYKDDTIPYSTVKVGLYSGSGALAEARLENAVGSGYQFGYFDSNRNFHAVGSTTETQLTMIADKNTTLSSGKTVGCYHILRSGSYGSFADAKAAADAIGGFPAYYSGKYYVLYGDYENAAAASEAIAATGISGEPYSASSRCMVVTETRTGKILFEFDYGSTYSLAIQPISTSGKAVTWFKGYKYYGSFQYARLTDNEKITVVNFVNIDDYVKGVLPYEMNGNFPVEALKAQALCARTYAASHFNSRRQYGFDIYADTWDQVYKGLNSASSATNAAADATAGQYIWYQGHLCETYFFSSSGGATESCLNVWGTELPYLQGVVDPYDSETSHTYDQWSYTLTAAQIQSKLNSKFSKCNLGTIASATPTYSDTGNCISITFTDTSGNSYTISRTNCYYGLDLPSLHFTIEQNSSGDFVINGGGWGHNCGLSQWGAYAMAKNHNMTASQIIKFYYTGVYVR